MTRHLMTRRPTTRHPTTQRRAQQGFTLIELMVAATIGLILMAAVGGVLSDSLRTAAALNSQAAINRHAREIFEILSYGGANPNANATAILPFRQVFGLRGRNPLGTGGDLWKMPAKDASLRSPFLSRDTGGATRLYRFVLTRDGAVPEGTLTDALYAEQIQDVTVPCTAADQPVQGCAVATSVTMQGFLRSEPGVTVQAQRGGVASVAVQLLDPRVQGSSRSFLTDQTITLWSAFTGLQEVAPWP